MGLHLFGCTWLQRELTCLALSWYLVGFSKIHLVIPLFLLNLVSIWSIPHKKKRSPGPLYLVISGNLKMEKYQRVEPTKNNFLAKVQFTHLITPRQMFSMENFSLEIMIQERKSELDYEKCQGTLLKSGFCCHIKNYNKISHFKVL